MSTLVLPLQIFLNSSDVSVISSYCCFVGNGLVTQKIDIGTITMIQNTTVTQL